jgi:hypothetical protein
MYTSKKKNYEPSSSATIIVYGVYPELVKGSHSSAFSSLLSIVEVF